MDRTCAPRAFRRGFTLVEMLVVIVIIGILSGLITAAAVMARNSAKRAMMVAEIHDLELALGAYKEQFGDYPPDFTDVDAVTRHLARAFPRYPASLPDPKGKYRYRWQSDLAVLLRINNPNQLSSVLNPTTALAFWLGGMRDEAGVPIGFSANPSDPFDLIGFNSGTPTSSRLGPFFQFDRKRLDKPEVDSSGNQIAVADRFDRYLPNSGNEQSEPYVYFKPRYYLVDTSKTPLEARVGRDPVIKKPRLAPTACTLRTNAVVRPYLDAEQFAQLDSRYGNDMSGETQFLRKLSNADSLWVNTQLFQILSPGLDGKYWNEQSSPQDPQPGNAFPTGDDYTSAQYDDITNFSRGTLKDKMP